MAVEEKGTANLNQSPPAVGGDWATRCHHLQLALVLPATRSSIAVEASDSPRSCTPTILTKMTLEVRMDANKLIELSSFRIFGTSILCLFYAD